MYLKTKIGKIALLVAVVTLAMYLWIKFPLLMFIIFTLSATIISVASIKEFLTFKKKN